ncbi:MAG: hypothetical protein VKN56_06425 [Cyanobacteriota bacterium]|nr:hypothetical protein [Cyanobacteriota bacterium]
MLHARLFRLHLQPQADGLSDVGQGLLAAFPWEWQPGRSRQLSDQPSSVCGKRILYDTLGSSTCLNASRPRPTTSAHP